MTPATAASPAPPPGLAHYPAGMPSHLTYPDRPLTALLDDAVHRWPERDALIFYGRRWSYRALETAVARLAASFAADGIGPGDRVALMLPNCPAYPIAFFAALRRGATVVQVSPLWIGDDLETLLADARPTAAVTLETLYSNLGHGEHGAAVPHVYVARLRELYPVLARPFVQLVLRRRGLPTAFPREPRVVPWSRALRPRSPLPPPVATSPGAVAVLQYTGGTTGTPKGAMLSHRNLFANVLQCNAANTTRRPGDEVILASIPLFHIYGLTVAFLLAVAEGGTIVLQIRPEPRELLRLIDRYRPSQLPAVPALYAALLDRPELARYRVNSIRYCLSGSAPLPPSLQQRFEAATGSHLVEGYGLTEASPVTHVNPAEGERRAGSVGLPLPDTEHRVVDPDGDRVLGLGEVGELEVRGPQVMLGYLHQPEETVAVLRDGWLRTGDLARLDGDGYAYIVDRKKDLIIVGGLKVYPREVEETLRRHDGVADVAVVAAPDRTLGEVPRAYVVRAAGATLDAAALIAFARAHLAHYKAPRSVEFLESLPKSGIQKTLRRELRRRAFAELPS